VSLDACPQEIRKPVMSVMIAVLQARIRRLRQELDEVEDEVASLAEAQQRVETEHMAATTAMSREPAPLLEIRDFVDQAPFPPLESETRTHVSTACAAYHLGRVPQTLRTWACFETGPLRPIRINGRLAWPVADLKQVLAGSRRHGYAKTPPSDQFT
jgi:uncharacterized membrane protein